MNILIEDALKRREIAENGLLNQRWISVLIGACSGGIVYPETFVAAINSAEPCHIAFPKKDELSKNADRLLKLVYIKRCLLQGFKLKHSQAYALLSKSNQLWQAAGRNHALQVALVDNYQHVFTELIRDIESADTKNWRSDPIQALGEAYGEILRGRGQYYDSALFFCLLNHSDLIMAEFMMSFPRAVGGRNSKRQSENGFKILADTIRIEHPNKEKSWIKKNVIERMKFGKIPNGLNVTVSNGKITVSWKKEAKSVTVKYFLYDMKLFD